MAFALCRKCRFLMASLNIFIFFYMAFFFLSSPRLSSNTGQDEVHSVKIVQNLIPCEHTLTPKSYIGQRGSYWVLYNYFKPLRTFRCDQYITYSTHSDYTFLDNLVPLLERWHGPLSISLYAPGSDFEESIKRIVYLRECHPSPLVKELVAFHIFFDQRHVPNSKLLRDLNTKIGDRSLPVNCSALMDDLPFGEELQTYKKRRNLSYPVNVGRNVAREMATTHFVLPSDIELYPSPNLIPEFIQMIQSNQTFFFGRDSKPKVFVLPIFEVEANVTSLPYDKRELLQMLRNKSAIPFHKYVCPYCHRIPKSEEWLKAPVEPGLHIFHTAKREKPFQYWEPIFIGTKHDPVYDERLSWDGLRDKMSQGYALCVLQYEFHILDNAFLVHRPGIKRLNKKRSKYKSSLVYKQNALISRNILPELKRLYGTKPGCFV